MKSDWTNYAQIAWTPDVYEGPREWTIQHYDTSKAHLRRYGYSGVWRFSSYNGGSKNQRRHTLQWCIDRIKDIRKANQQRESAGLMGVMDINLYRLHNRRTRMIIMAAVLT